MQRYFLELFFKGTHYSGWQIQKNAVSVQKKVNEAINTLLSRNNIETTGCGRTDAGVHATQFFAHFDSPEIISDTGSFVYHLNGILPADITAVYLHTVNQEAHARFDAVKRTYHYYIHSQKNGFLSEYSACYFKKPDIALLQQVSNLLTEYSDFNSFCKSRAQSRTTLCKIYHAEWKEKNEFLIFEITADRFLRGMVRALVGTMADVGQQKLSVDDFKNILDAKDRRKAGHAAPACGLYLTKIEYPYLTTKNHFSFPF